jgi:hypothetical protein
VDLEVDIPRPRTDEPAENEIDYEVPNDDLREEVVLEAVEYLAAEPWEVELEVELDE